MNRRIVVLASCFLCACSTTSGGSGGVSGSPDVSTDIFGKFTGGDSTSGSKDSGSGDSGGSDGAVVDTGEDSGSEDIGSDPIDSGGGSDVSVTDSGKDGKVTKDGGAETAIGDSSDASIDVPASCGNGTCESGEACANCALDCACKPCNPLSNKGCASDQQCYTDGKSLQCLPFGKAGDGGACTNLNDCQKGFLCISSVCRQVCETTGKNSSFACVGSAYCDTLMNSSGEIGFNLGACFPADNCNLVSSGGCAAGKMCLPGDKGSVCVTAGKGGLDATCASYLDCGADYLCTSDGTSASCLQRCDTTNAKSCPSGLTCTGATSGTPPKADADNLGVCAK